MYNRTLPDIWRPDRGNGKSKSKKKRNKYIHIFGYVKIVYNIF